MRYFIYLFILTISLLNAETSLPKEQKLAGSKSDIYAQCKSASKNITEYRSCKEKKLKEFEAIENMQKKIGESSYKTNEFKSPFIRQRDSLVEKLDASITKTTFIRNCIAVAEKQDEIEACKKMQMTETAKYNTENYGKEKEISAPVSQQQKVKQDNKLPLPPLGLGI